MDVRTLATQFDGAATTLWAGVAEADPRKPGSGCQRARPFDADIRWQQVNSGWTGGGCRDLLVDGPVVLAATQSAGVLRLDTGAAAPEWRIPDVTCGLPLRDRTRFQPVTALAAATGGRAFAATGQGVYMRSTSGRWSTITDREVTIPSTWLFCSDEHDIEVVTE